MRVVILGASGACGRELVREAAGRGHDVVAVVRPSSELPENDAVRVCRGDLCAEDFLRGCFEGAEVVLSALGFRIGGLAPWNKPPDPDFLRASALAVVAAAQSTDVQRIMAISSGGVGDSWEIVPAAFRAFVRCSSLRHVLPRLDEMEQVYLRSGLDVCMVRPSGLTNASATGAAVVTQGFAGQAQIPRADVAAWMLEALQASPFAHRTPVITVTGALGS